MRLGAFAALLTGRCREARRERWSKLHALCTPYTWMFSSLRQKVQNCGPIIAELKERVKDAGLKARRLHKPCRDRAAIAAPGGGIYWGSL